MRVAACRGEDCCKNSNGKPTDRQKRSAICARVLISTEWQQLGQRGRRRQRAHLQSSRSYERKIKDVEDSYNAIYSTMGSPWLPLRTENWSSAPRRGVILSLRWEKQGSPSLHTEGNERGEFKGN